MAAVSALQPGDQAGPGLAQEWASKLCCSWRGAPWWTHLGTAVGEDPLAWAVENTCLWVQPENQFPGWLGPRWSCTHLVPVKHPNQHATGPNPTHFRAAFQVLLLLLRRPIWKNPGAVMTSHASWLIPSSPTNLVLRGNVIISVPVLSSSVRFWEPCSHWDLSPCPTHSLVGLGDHQWSMSSSCKMNKWRTVDVWKIHKTWGVKEAFRRRVSQLRAQERWLAELGECLGAESWHFSGVMVPRTRQGSALVLLLH